MKVKDVLGDEYEIKTVFVEAVRIGRRIEYSCWGIYYVGLFCIPHKTLLSRSFDFDEVFDYSESLKEQLLSEGKACLKEYEKMGLIMS